MQFMDTPLPLDMEIENLKQIKKFTYFHSIMSKKKCHGKARRMKAVCVCNQKVRDKVELTLDSRRWKRAKSRSRNMKEGD